MHSLHGGCESWHCMGWDQSAFAVLLFHPLHWMALTTVFCVPVLCSCSLPGRSKARAAGHQTQIMAATALRFRAIATGGKCRHAPTKPPAHDGTPLPHDAHMALSCAAPLALLV